MSNKSPLNLEQLEARLSRWEKWVYLCLGAAIVLLMESLIKGYENVLLDEMYFTLQTNRESIEFLRLHSMEWSLILYSPWRFLLWLVVEIAALAPAAILGLASHWRRVALSKRLNLIAGFLLADWLNLIALGATNPLDMGAGYNVLVIFYLLLLGGGYWAMHRKRTRIEEMFP